MQIRSPKKVTPANFGQRDNECKEALKAMDDTVYEVMILGRNQEALFSGQMGRAAIEHALLDYRICEDRANMLVVAAVAADRRACDATLQARLLRDRSGWERQWLISIATIPSTSLQRICTPSCRKSLWQRLDRNNRQRSRCSHFQGSQRSHG